MSSVAASLSKIILYRHNVKNTWTEKSAKILINYNIFIFFKIDAEQI